ncbi:TetR/AcrR family transcriptional regulator [Alkalimarinus sediminis]|uniref:TetR/AcrR family transcriptional regulator n=1 Tax=Alkalimarinus sediminis TaxID=1632866 RepID=A0A9E8HHW0_9ALTE|nr:TetR/AcrR family transcriptional regulator [Alkalimarinus sediminis]UZW73647.1 TetR/AcrR family transcriptional regulator [Alkalimarinus sediminis]
MKSELEVLVEEGYVTNPDSARGRLLVKAAHLFKKKGYERTTVRDLANEVGIQSGSIFHHFKTKEQILKAVMEEAIRYNTARMKRALANATSTKERLLELIKCELTSITGFTGEAMSVLVYEWRSLSEESQADILSLRDIYEQLWLDVLDEAKEEGLIAGDTFILRRFLTGALSWTTTWFDERGGMTLDDLAEQALLLAVKS